MPRRLFWLQVFIGWVPLWVVFAVLLLTAHPGITFRAAAAVSTRMMLAGVLLSPLVLRLVRRIPWPTPMQARFVLTHLAATGGYALAWFVVNSLIESVARGQAVVVIGFSLASYLILGVWLYVMQAGVLYAAESASRASRAEASAAQAQLAALRGQLHPHFLFNALHTIVHLAPESPDRAAKAAEDVAGLLRVALGEQRDLVPWEDEWRFVSRYLEVEQVRFGERLRVVAQIEPDVTTCLVPSFALQTLVENAVRHGAAPRVERTTIRIRARRDGAVLHVEVADDGAGMTPSGPGASAGSGLRRLRERLVGLFGDTARIEVEPNDAGRPLARGRGEDDAGSPPARGRGVIATLRLPVRVT